MRPSIVHRTEGDEPVTQRAAGALVGHVRQMSILIEGDRLVAGVVAGHVALSAIYTKALQFVIAVINRHP